MLAHFAETCRLSNTEYLNCCVRMNLMQFLLSTTQRRWISWKYVLPSTKQYVTARYWHLLASNCLFVQSWINTATIDDQRFCPNVIKVNLNYTNFPYGYSINIIPTYSFSLDARASVPFTRSSCLSPQCHRHHWWSQTCALQHNWFGAIQDSEVLWVPANEWFI